MSRKFKTTVSHFYAAMLAATFILTVLDNSYWWLFVLTYLIMRFVANLIEKEDLKFKQRNKKKTDSPASKNQS